MTHRVFAAAVLGAVACLASTPDLSHAFGGRLFKKDSGGDCGTCAAPAPAACGSTCGSAAYAPAYAAPAMTWVEKEVDVQEAKMVTTPTKVKVLKMVEVERDVVYKVAVMKPTKQEVTSYEWVSIKEPRKVMECVTTSKDVMVDVVSYQCVPKMVTTMVAVCRRVPVAPACPTACEVPTCAPACAPACDTPKRVGLFARLCGKRNNDCAPACAAPVCYTTVTEMVPVTRCVYENVRIDSKVATKVYSTQMVEKNVDVMVNKCVAVKKMIDVQVCEWVDKKEKAKVWECKEVEETVNVTSCVYVTVKRKVQVAVAAPVAMMAAPCGPVCAPACAPTYAPTCEPTCEPTCTDAKAPRLGLFKRLCGKTSGGC